MKKKLYLILSILIIIFLLSSAAICNSCQAQNSEETLNQALEEDNQKKETEKELAEKEKYEADLNKGSNTTSGENKSGNNDSQSTNNANNNPIINGIIISALDSSETAHSKEEWYVDANQQNFLTADVSDPDNDILTYKWSADGGLFDNPAAFKVIWSAPAFPETYHINIEISDGKGGKASFSKVLRVVDTSIGSPPVVSDI